MKSMLRLRLSVKKRLLVLSVLMLVVSARVMAQSATQLKMENSDLETELLQEKQPPVEELTIEEVMEIAEEEIERTAQAAVKSALLEVAGDLAFEKDRADQMAAANLALEAENKRLKEEVQKKQNQFFYGALIGGAGGVVVTSLVFGLIMGAIK